ncbi:hypothetical protein PU560_16410 [Georgenia sp. 10Sc9-8]|uniref:Integral membrane protein n=1 Tax=Georgenia halotolerans TaxID=3028317 RepID=A0ABT5U126_9MICO|nr:hypothetical protein [Georgenia halotolerans]
MSNEDQHAPRGAPPAQERTGRPASVPGARATDAATSGRARPSTAGPAAPVPPRPRARWHVLAVVVGLLVTPLGLWLLGLGISDLSPLTTGEPALRGLLWVLAGAVALSVVAAAGALGSSLALIVGGTVWAAAPGLLGVLGVLRAEPTATGYVTDRTTGTLDLLLPTGFLLTVGVVLIAAGVAVHVARRAGRHQERADAALVADAVRRGTRTPVPPASRLTAHLASTVVALLLMPLSLVMLSRAAGWLRAVDEGEAGWGSDVASLLALLAALACVTAVMLTAGASSLGPQLAGWVMAVLPAVGVLLRDMTGWSWLDAPIDAVTRTPGSLLLVTTDFLLYLGVVTIVGGAAAHWARRHGRHLERSELALRAC